MLDRFQTTGLPKVWDALGIGYARFSDEGSNHRSLDQQLLNVLTKAQREGVFALGIAWFIVDDLSRLSRSTIESLRTGD